MHTESSLSLFQETTTKFGQLMRQFRDLSCSEFVTLELPRDIQARGQRPNVTQVQPRPQPLDAPILNANAAMTPILPAVPPTPVLNLDAATTPILSAVLPSAIGPPLTGNPSLHELRTGNENPVDTGSSLPTVSAPAPVAVHAKKTRMLNLYMPKFHFLGDYVHHIRTFGTTDSYSTQLVRHCRNIPISVCNHRNS